ncbi:MAG: sulfate ABC transporter ATP-binding protein [Alphaproteobacteria bacterium]|nr:sulfate ABC transporter ATP-binding protein [Alphaproteobacteria bacterium]
MQVRIEGVTKSFGDHPALKDLSLKVGSGQLFALLGPSGSGKTTLLRLIAGLERADAGAVYFGDVDASRIPIQRRRVGFVFQHYALFRHMTMFDNIAFGILVRRKEFTHTRDSLRRRCLELLDLVQLSGLEDRYPHQLSGGQRQRVALARALAIEPSLLLLDEPFGALDARVRKDLRRWIRELHTKTGHTTLFVTHDQEEALELADAVVVLNDGRVEQIGTPEQIYSAPASPFVFNFIGDSARIPGSAINGGWRGPRPPEDADIFIRPQDVTIVGPHEGAIHGDIVGVRRLADIRRVVVRTGAGDIEVNVADGKPTEMGAAVGLQFDKWRTYRNGVLLQRD